MLVCTPTLSKCMWGIKHRPHFMGVLGDEQIFVPHLPMNAAIIGAIIGAC